MIWVFGYGSLMWDGWESNYGCSRRVVADLLGYRRVFNKASVKNWGTKTAPCPTLNLSKVDPGACRGVAFELPDNCRERLLAYLRQREGKQFGLRELPVRLEDGAEVTALVPFYEGKNLIGREWRCGNCRSGGLCERNQRLLLCVRQRYRRQAL